MVIGGTQCSLEGRFKYVRTRETNLGNLVTDVMRKTLKADVALLNSGTLRSDCVHEPGVFKMKARKFEYCIHLGLPWNYGVVW